MAKFYDRVFSDRRFSDLLQQGCNQTAFFCDLQNSCQIGVARNETGVGNPMKQVSFRVIHVWRLNKNRHWQLAWCLSRFLVSSLVCWFACSLASLLAGLRAQPLTGLLAGWFAGALTCFIYGLLVCSLPCSLACWLVALAGWPGWLAGCLPGRLVGLLDLLLACLLLCPPALLQKKKWFTPATQQYIQTTPRHHE